MGEDRTDGKKLRYCYDREGICGFRYYNGSEWKSYTYVKNPQGDIILIKDDMGTPKVKYTYDPWGNVTYRALNLDGGEANPEEDELAQINPFRYRGYYYDEESKLYYLITRYYDPWEGIFISPDSFEYLDPETIGGVNLYAYCNYNPIMYVDPEGKWAFLSLAIVTIFSAAVAAVSSAFVQSITTGGVKLEQVGIAALFGAIGGLLSFTGIGGVIGQFVIQGALAVGELYTIAALDGSASSIGFAQVVATFLFAGALGALGGKGASKDFKRLVQIEADFIKYASRDIIKYGASVFKTLANRGAKYFSELFVHFIKQSLIISGITATANVSDYWIQKWYDYYR